MQVFSTQRRHGLDAWVGTITWRKKWQPTPVFSPGKSHGRGGTWKAIVHGVAKSQTRLRDFTFFSLLLKIQIKAFHFCMSFA